MPQISIRTSEEFYNTETYSGNGKACKFIVSQLLAMDPDLSLAEVRTDTDSSYSVRLRVMGQPDVGLSIENSSTTLYIGAGYWNRQGNFVTTSYNTRSVGSYFGYYYSYGASDPSWYSHIKVSVLGVDGVLKYIVFSSSRTTEVAYMYYGMFTSTAYADPQYCVGCAENSLNATYPFLPQIPFGATLPTVIRDSVNDSYEIINFSSFGSTDGFIKAGYSYALMPQAYQGTSTNKGFLNIKWGGKYNPYLLYGPDGVVKTRPGDIVTINGVEMLSPGYVTVIE